MKILVETLGEEAARNFLQFALPKVTERSEELIKSIEAQNWEDAATQAHRFKGTVMLYGSSSLLQKLQNIINKNKDHIKNENFIQELKAELDQTQNSIKTFLAR